MLLNVSRYWQPHTLYIKQRLILQNWRPLIVSDRQPADKNIACYKTAQNSEVTEPIGLYLSQMSQMPK